MNKYITAILFSFLLFEAHVKAQHAINSQVNTSIADSDWVFDKVAGSRLLFKNRQKFNTGLYQLKYVGSLPNGNKAPYLIFSGRDCRECDANISIYIHSPTNGLLGARAGANSYQYPGKERDIETNKLDYSSRAFYGEVLKDTFGVIWYENRLLEKNKWGNFIFLVKLYKGKKRELHLTDWKLLAETLQLLKDGLCKEIKGMDYTSEP